MDFEVGKLYFNDHRYKKLYKTMNPAVFETPVKEELTPQQPFMVIEVKKNTFAYTDYSYEEQYHLKILCEDKVRWIFWTVI